MYLFAKGVGSTLHWTALLQVRTAEYHSICNGFCLQHTHTHTHTHLRNSFPPILQSWGDCPLWKSKHVIGILPASGAIQNSDPNFFHSLLGCKLAWCYWTISLTWNGDASNVNRICFVFFEGVLLLMSCEFHPGTQPTLPWQLHHFSPTKTGENFRSWEKKHFSPSAPIGAWYPGQLHKRNPIWSSTEHLEEPRFLDGKWISYEVVYCLVSMDIIPQMEISIQHIYDKQFDVSVLFFCTYSNSTPMVVFIFTRNHFLSKDVGCLDSPKQWRSATWQLPQGFICRRIIGSILIDLKFDRKWLSNFQL